MYKNKYTWGLDLKNLELCYNNKYYDALLVIRKYSHIFLKNLVFEEKWYFIRSIVCCLKYSLGIFCIYRSFSFYNLVIINLTIIDFSISNTSIYDIDLGFLIVYISYLVNNKEKKRSNIFIQKEQDERKRWKIFKSENLFGFDWQI